MDWDHLIKTFVIGYSVGGLVGAIEAVIGLPFSVIFISVWFVGGLIGSIRWVMKRKRDTAEAILELERYAKELARRANNKD